MSIGKNAIKRVENNGYSKVKTEAPDMINSTVIGATDKQVLDMIEKQVAKKPATAKTTATKKPATTKTTTAKKPATAKPIVKVEKLTPPTLVVEEVEKLAPVKEEPVKVVKKPVKAVKKDDKVGKSYAFGEELPVYLL